MLLLVGCGFGDCLGACVCVCVLWGCVAKGVLSCCLMLVCFLFFSCCVVNRLAFVGSGYYALCSRLFRLLLLGSMLILYLCLVH